MAGGGIQAACLILIADVVGKFAAFKQGFVIHGSAVAGAASPPLSRFAFAGIAVFEDAGLDFVHAGQIAEVFQGAVFVAALPDAADQDLAVFIGQLLGVSSKVAADGNLPGLGVGDLVFVALYGDAFFVPAGLANRSTAVVKGKLAFGMIGSLPP